MKKNHFIFVLLVLAFFLEACGIIPQISPLPLATYTMAPTYTPYPTYTPFPSPTISGSPQPVPTLDPTSRFSAVVTPENVLFWFKINPSISTWEWNMVPDNYLEYEWTVTFPIETNGFVKTYTLSLEKIDLANSDQPEQGSLEDLLSVCELKLLIFDNFSSYPTSVNNQDISYSVSNGGIQFEVTKADLVQIFNRDKPAYVFFKTNSSNNSVPYTEIYVKVFYP